MYLFHNTGFHFKIAIPSLLVVICSHAIVVRADISVEGLNIIYYCFSWNLSKCPKQGLTLEFAWSYAWCHKQACMILGKDSDPSLHVLDKVSQPSPQYPGKDANMNMHSP